MPGTGSQLGRASRRQFLTAENRSLQSTHSTDRTRCRNVTYSVARDHQQSHSNVTFPRDRGPPFHKSHPTLHRASSSPVERPGVRRLSRLHRQPSIHRMPGIGGGRHHPRRCPRPVCRASGCRSEEAFRNFKRTLGTGPRPGIHHWSRVGGGWMRFGLDAAPSYRPRAGFDALTSSNGVCNAGLPNF